MTWLQNNWWILLLLAFVAMHFFGHGRGHGHGGHSRRSHRHGNEAGSAKPDPWGEISDGSLSPRRQEEFRRDGGKEDRL